MQNNVVWIYWLQECQVRTNSSLPYLDVNVQITFAEGSICSTALISWDSQERMLCIATMLCFAPKRRATTGPLLPTVACSALVHANAVQFGHFVIKCLLLSKLDTQTAITQTMSRIL